MEKTKKYAIYGGASLLSFGLAAYWYYVRNRYNNRTDFQRYLDDVDKKINDKVYDNQNPYLNALFASFSTESKEQLKQFELIKKQKFSQKQTKSDPLLPPFEKGAYVSSLGAYHSILFDFDARI